MNCTSRVSHPKLFPYSGSKELHPKDQDTSHADAIVLIQIDWFRNSDSEWERNWSMVSSKIRVLLADDCAEIRQFFAKFLNESPDIEIAGEASNGRVAVELTKLLVPDVVIMDIHMPEMNGIEATQAIRNSLPQVGVVGLSSTDDSVCRNAMRRAGAAAFVSKFEPLHTVLAAIRTCCPARRC